MVEQLNEIGGRNGVGRIDMVENRFVGMKSRGVYEAPGMTILYDAQLYARTADHGPRPDAPARSAGARSGRDGLLRLLVLAQDGCPVGLHSRGPEAVTGEVQLQLYKGNIMVDGRSSPNSLYDEGIATMEGGGSYNQTDAEGFLRIQGFRAGCRDASRRAMTDSEVATNVSGQCVASSSMRGAGLPFAIVAVW